ncbi:bile acid:sodium symporter family protein [Paludibacterium yongneupense]|uniref:bile acid:sodium symporter family protein n=1 Tax=Paludibacterium yongneupense TaxID=400061 RepID=UPI000425516B|nr:bile acid:sodium symporter family protein [Paludibacterium yongneupense]
MTRPAYLPDTFTLALIGSVALASLLPCHGQGAVIAGAITNVAISLLFFLHGAKLSRESVIAGATHWRLHLVVFASTFVVFPALGLLLAPLLSRLLTPDLALGILYLCLLPSTVQSSIAFTAVARGNVPAAICSASASNLIGIFLTPLLVGALLATHGNATPSFDAVISIVLQLLLPFMLGQGLRPWLGGWISRHRPLVGRVDQSSILLVVYTAFSAAVIQGLWHQMPARALLGLVLVNAALLALVLALTTLASRTLRFNKEDEITIVFCGSKKSLASGVPMAQVLFAGHPVGAIVLPLMLFHQIQLMACAALAQRHARRPEGDAGASADIA